MVTTQCDALSLEVKLLAFVTIQVYFLKPVCDSQRCFRCMGKPPVLLLVLGETTGAAFGAWGIHRCCFWCLGNAPVLLLVLGESTGAAFDYFCIQVT
jgi:hypothetical protein